MPMTIPFEIRIDPTVQTDIFLTDPADIDIFNVGSPSLPLCCPLCRHAGTFSRRTMTRSKFHVTREFQCPVCMSTIALTVRIG